MTDQPPAGVALKPLDFNGLSDTFERNPRWIETDQEMVWTAINHIRGDYVDADEDAAEQVIERLLHIIRRQNLALSTPASGAVEAAERSARKALAHLAADERDRCRALSALLVRAREYVTDALEAHEHSDGRELLVEIDAALTSEPKAAPVAPDGVEGERERLIDIICDAAGWGATSGLTKAARVADAILAARAQPPAAEAWTCFHCAETFNDERNARLHFGADEEAEPACKIKGSEGGLLEALRRAERQLADAWHSIHSESGEAAQAYYAQNSRHREQLTAVEQVGYDRGFADAKADPEALGIYAHPPAEPAVRGGDDQADTERMKAEIARLTAALNTPEVEDFAKGVVAEAQHQRERWSVDHDAGKAPLDWFWLIGFLAQKAATSQIAGDVEKALHHTISTAAAMANWHAAISGQNTAMRPGIATPSGEEAAKPIAEGGGE